MAETTVVVEGVEELRRKLKVLLSNDRRKAMSEHVGRFVMEKVKDHLDEMSVSRHKCADRLGARYTHYLEYASGRMGGSVSGEGKQGVVLKDPTESSITISIQNTPGLRRAFRDLIITPKKAKALTIPLHKVSYGKRVADLRKEGHEVFKLGNTNILAENERGKTTVTNKKGKKTKVNKVRPLYSLVKKVTVPQDKGLLPSKDEYQTWSIKAVKGFLRAESL